LHHSFGIFDGIGKGRKLRRAGIFVYANCHQIVFAFGRSGRTFFRWKNKTAQAFVFSDYFL
jgi:hypothetical protein